MMYNEHALGPARRILENAIAEVRDDHTMNSSEVQCYLNETIDGIANYVLLNPSDRERSKLIHQLHTWHDVNMSMVGDALVGIDEQEETAA